MTGRRAGPALLVALVLGAGLLVGAAPAQACFCQHTSLSEIGDRSVVFVGAAGTPDRGPGGRIRTPVAVEGVYQGEVPAATRVVTGSVGFSCNDNLAPGTSYLILATRGEDGSLYTGACSGTRVATPDTRERAERVLGPPAAPLPDPVLVLDDLLSSLFGP